MEVFVLVGFFGMITALLSYRHQVFDYFVYVVSLICMLLAFVWWVVLGETVFALVLFGLGIIMGGLMFLFRYIKHL